MSQRLKRNNEVRPCPRVAEAHGGLRPRGRLSSRDRGSRPSLPVPSSKGRIVLALATLHQSSLKALETLTREAGAIALGFFSEGGATSADVNWKGDGSPVTEADLAVNAFLEPRLKALWPGAAWLSEESADDQARIGAQKVIIVDPIDGTRGFARGDRHWCIAIALCEGGRPVCAIVHAPALGDTYTAEAGGGAFLNGDRLRVAEARKPDDGMRVTCPQNVAAAFRQAGVAFDCKPKIASLALRIAMVATSHYDAGYASKSSHDWDLAAADLVLQEAGGLLAGLDGLPLVYNKADPSHSVLTACARVQQPFFRAALAKTAFG